MRECLKNVLNFCILMDNIFIIHFFSFNLHNIYK